MVINSIPLDVCCIDFIRVTKSQGYRLLTVYCPSLDFRAMGYNLLGSIFNVWYQEDQNLIICINCIFILIIFYIIYNYYFSKMCQK